MYKPTQTDIDWTRRLIDTLNHNAVWGIPRNESIWRLDKEKKVFRLIHGAWNDPCNRALIAICPKLGYTTEHAPEQLTPEQVKTYQSKVTLAEDQFGTGKSMTSVQPSTAPLKKYMWRTITPEDRAAHIANLAKLPAQFRWKGKTTPQCDFCASDNPTVMYGAKRMTTGEQVECWRWQACPDCHAAITRNDFQTIERRAAFVLAAGNSDFAIKMSLMAFHADAIQI